MAALPAWRMNIQKLLQEYPAITSKFLTLATVDEHTKPRSRYVVFRQWHDNNSLVVVSDNRHNKVRHLAHNANFEVCWYFNDARLQYRISGQAKLLTSASPEADLELRQSVWASLSDSTRVQYTWPKPEADLDRDALASAIPASQDQAAPETFTVVLLVPDAVDVLQLGGEIQREQHTLEGDGSWSVKLVNP
eukprot:m.27105 g.27105  ORF g.27105 m.27105 type:complete len:192 (-) comp11752_c0_seq1:785-1360(-)